MPYSQYKSYFNASYENCGIESAVGNFINTSVDGIITREHCKSFNECSFKNCLGGKLSFFQDVISVIMDLFCIYCAPIYLLWNCVV